MSGPGIDSGRRRRRTQPLAALAVAAASLLAPATGLACTGGGLGLTAPSSLGFPDTPLTGADQTVTTTLALVGNDATGTGTGWRLTGTSTTLKSGGDTLPTTATSVTAVVRTAGTGNCRLPANSVTYPVTLPAGGTAPTAAKLFSAAAGTGGTGRINLAMTFAIAIPANARVGSYGSTWTLSLVSGP